MDSISSSHSFLVPTYGYSPHLRSCLYSLRAQTKPSPIIISTSTPFEGIENLASEFNAKLFVHKPNLGIAHDWNQGLNEAHTDWVTIAHQDDVYLPEFVENVTQSILSTENPTLVFTDYAEIIDNGTIRPHSRLLQIKKALLNLGFLGRSSISDSWSKINTLRFGSPIPCPSVTLRPTPGIAYFEQGFRLNMDWAAWIRNAQAPGSFVWIRKELMHHRIHEQSETSAGIALGYRRDEDIAILRRLWPPLFARLIAATYALAYRSNSH